MTAQPGAVQRVAVLASGRGSNLRALLTMPPDRSRVVRLICNEPNAAAVAMARDAGVPVTVVDHRRFPDRSAFDQALARHLAADNLDWLVLAGFMRILTAPFVEQFAGRLINIHPSLLPAFRGRHTHTRALAAGVPYHGASVHFVTADLDAGPVIAQVRVPVLPQDTEAALAARVLSAEHLLLPHTLGLCVTGAVGLHQGSLHWATATPGPLQFRVVDGHLSPAA